MSNTIHRHMIRYPSARASTIQYLARRDEMLERLRKEVRENELRHQREIDRAHSKPKGRFTIRWPSWVWKW